MHIEVDNQNPRIGPRGEIIDLHDGALEFFAGRLYWYGTAYGNTNGFKFDNVYRVYSSPDLNHWTDHGELIPKRPQGVYYRPYVKCCPTTGDYVLWYNWYATLWNGQYGVAVSKEPHGPFEIVNENVEVRHGHPGDHGLFVDDDGAGYLIYTSIAAKHSISIERLAPDFLSSTKTGSEFLSTGDEACALFKRGSNYYALFDKCCCFCPQGSGAKVFVAQSVLGPYVERGNINRHLAPGPGRNEPIINAQQAHVACFPSTNGPLFVWTGDCWGSRRDGIKGHDFQFWSAPLVFDPDGGIQPLKWASRWSFELKD